MLYTCVFNSKIGNIQINADEKSILTVSLTNEAVNFLNKNEIIDETIKQLGEYFNGNRKEFTLPLNPQGTEFQKKVWQELLKIPYGETRSYKQIAELIGNKNASRAVGNTCNKNPIAIIIPCHRIIGNNGLLVGYAYGKNVKNSLLNLEKSKKDFYL